MIYVMYFFIQRVSRRTKNVVHNNSFDNHCRLIKYICLYTLFIDVNNRRVVGGREGTVVFNVRRVTSRASDEVRAERGRWQLCRLKLTVGNGAAKYSIKTWRQLTASVVYFTSPAKCHIIAVYAGLDCFLSLVKR